MKTAQFNAYCPYEIGDKIKVLHVEPLNPVRAFAVHEEVHTITDIMCVHYLRGGNVEFRLELDNSGVYRPIADMPAAANHGQIIQRTDNEQAQPEKGQAAPAAAEVGPTKPVPTSTVNGLPPDFVKFIKACFG